MNQNNYGSLEACKRLVEAGIVLETEAVWCLGIPTWDHRETTWNLHYRNYVETNKYQYKETIPALSMAEAWRELPETYCVNATDPVRGKFLTSKSVGYWAGGKDAGKWFPIRGNITNCIIDLLIWQRKEKGDE